MDSATEKKSRETSLRKYFAETRAKKLRNIGIVLLGVAVAILLANLSAGHGDSKHPTGLGCAVMNLVSFGGPGLAMILIALRMYRPQPTDAEVDAWFTEARTNLVGEAVRSLGISEDELVSEPLVVTGPILWKTPGIPDRDLALKRGADGVARFSVYRLSVIVFTDRHLGAFATDYNFIKDVHLNDSTREYHYRDVVSVSTSEESTSYTLPTGEKLTSVQEFRLSVASGESIAVAIDAAQIRKLAGVDSLTSTGAEQAVQAIRAMLREKKS